MALDTLEAISASLLARCPTAGILLARDWVNQGYRRLAERRRWSWLYKFGQIEFPAAYATGAVNVTQNSTTVTGVGTAWTAALATRQFRIGLTVPIYTIASVNVGAQTLELTVPYGSASLTSSSYTIYLAYMTPPTDFHSFISGVDPVNRWRLWFNNLTQMDLDMIDPQRSYTGAYPFTFVFRDYGDIVNTPPMPRYEVWPHVVTAKVIPYLYETRVSLDDVVLQTAYLPRYIRGDVILEYALWQAAQWPGTEDRKNPMFNLALADRYRTNYEWEASVLERQDDEVGEQDLTYSEWSRWGMAPFPITSTYIQSHGI